MTPVTSHSTEIDVTSARRDISLLLTLLILGSTLALISLPLPTAQAASGTVKEMTFLLHHVNATETAKPLPGGGSTQDYFDTTLDFNDVNVSVLVEGPEKILKWYLSPALAGSFQVDQFTLRIWANSSTGASSGATITIGLYEVTALGSAQIHENNFGSQSFTVTSELRNWASSFPSHTFQAGSSIELRLKATPGANQGVWFHYDTPQVNSRLGLRSPSSIDVASVTALDSEGNVTLNFDPGAATKDMTFWANVTDPLGGYDIVWVNLTLLSPFDTIIIDNVSILPKVSGTPVDFESVYELDWNYSGQPNGQYTVEIWAVDRNGHNHYYFFQQFTFGPYPDTGNGTFSIGGLPHYVNVKTVDATGGILAGALVVLVNAGFKVSQNTTDTEGLTNLSMSKDTYEFQVYWQDILVGSVVQLVDANVSAAAPLELSTRVYSPVFQAQTADGSPLPGATFLLVHPNGNKLDPRKSDADGLVPLTQVPEGNYSLEVSWRGVSVFSGILTVDANGVLAVPTAVYELEVIAISAEQNPLPGVFVQVTDETGLVFDAGVTDANGAAVLLLPQGSYTVQARYVTTHLGTLYDSGSRTASVDLMDSQSLTIPFQDFPVPLTSTRYFQLGLAYLATLAALLFALFRARRGRSGESEESYSEPEA